MKKFLVNFNLILGLVFGALGGNFGRAEIVFAEGDLTEVESEEEADLPEMYLKAVNPGYTISGVSNVGEMIEIGRNSDNQVSLAGATVGYTNSSGNFSTLVEFPENSWITGETILLRLASSSELAAMTYKVPGSSSGLAQGAGPLVLMRDGEVVDSVCWSGAEGCYRKFKSGSGESLVRVSAGEWEFRTDYEPEFIEGSYVIEEVAEPAVKGHCSGLEFSEILSYYENSKEEQFIEIYNSSSSAILLDGCLVRYKSKTEELAGILREEEYLAIRPTEFSLTKNPTNSNKIELIDVDGTVLDTLEYFNGQRKGTAYALIGYDAAGKEIWRTTYAPTPGEANNYQEFRSCEEGKVINEATGNCVKVTSVVEKICGEGQYLNILTGRCKKYETASTKTCKEGYYLNPETNRCRKIQDNTGADYSLLTETYEEKSSFTALYAILGVVLVGVLYVIFEFRKEILRLFRRVFRRSR
ncbi:hypothetical protein IJJ49_02710 [Candidatus Saccharibacteria bacterium]|nr:hypothetical protein [Candidatus Saccharibacteria bacterium]